MRVDAATLEDLEKSIKGLANGGVIAAAVLAVLLVAFNIYGRRFSLPPAVRLLVSGASMVFLPLCSAVLSALKGQSKETIPLGQTGRSNPDVQNMWTVLLWIVLILALMCNANVCSPASSDVSVVDGNRTRPPVESLAKYAWLAYLIYFCVPVALAGDWLEPFEIAIFVAFTALGLAKLVLRLAAFYRAKSSFALGKNARLIAGYTDQLADDDEEEKEPIVPRYIVMGEKKKHVDERPQGYRVKREALEDKLSGLVTLDRVWRLAEHGADGVLSNDGGVQLRDLCLSYSLFKMLRRGLLSLSLSGHPHPLSAVDPGSAESLSFVLRGMDSAQAAVKKPDADRVFRVLVDELWFASDFYYSPVPLCVLSGWCAALSYAFSLLTIAGAVAVGCIYQKRGALENNAYMVITYALLLTLVLVEAWETVAGVCSNWTKMALLGHYIRHHGPPTWQRRSLRAVLRLRPASRWRDKLGQCSVLEPRRFRGLFNSNRSVRVSPLVRDAVLRSLLNTYGHGHGHGNGKVVDDVVGSAPARRRVAAGGNGNGKVDWTGKDAGGDVSSKASNSSSSNTEVILVWHVATRLFEMKSTSPSPDMIAACHLSYYCAYLVAAAPELLPDAVPWTKARYREVSDDVAAAALLVGGESTTTTTAGERYERLVAELSREKRDTVLRRGAELGRRLVEEYADDEAAACRKLADFWAEMLLFVAPSSENVRGHVQAMARGGEFVTLVWALLLHAGVTARPTTSPSVAFASDDIP